MVKIKTEYEKDGKKIPLKTPQIKIGNNLGEEESVTVKFLQGVYENTFVAERGGKKVDCKAYAFLAEFEGQNVYVSITDFTCQKLCKQMNVATYKDLFVVLQNKKITFTRYIIDAKTLIEVIVEGVDSENIVNKIQLNKEQIIQIFMKEKKSPDDIIEFEGKKQTFKEILGEGVISVLR